jgi:hypothetical protein
MAKAADQFGAAIKAEELRGRLRRFYVDQVEHGAAHEFDHMSNSELRQWIAAETRALGLDVDPPKVASTANGARGKKH